MKKHLFLISVFLSGFITLLGQSHKMEKLDVISTTGSSLESENMVVSWTIGNNIIDFVQIQEALATRPEDKPGVMKMKDGTLIKVYPTLTNGPLTIKIRADETTRLRAEFFDLQGSKLKIVNLNADEVEVNLTNFKHGMYILKIINADTADKKIIKIVRQ